MKGIKVFKRNGKVYYKGLDKTQFIELIEKATSYETGKLNRIARELIYNFVNHKHDWINRTLDYIKKVEKIFNTKVPVWHDFTHTSGASGDVTLIVDDENKVAELIFHSATFRGAGQGFIFELPYEEVKKNLEKILKIK